MPDRPKHGSGRTTRLGRRSIAARCRAWPAATRIAGAAAALVAIGISAAAATAAGPVPGRSGAAAGVDGGAFAIVAADLAQSGQQLRWTVVLEHDFSASTFGAGRTLCLLIERRTGGQTGQLCVAPPRARGGPIRLTFAAVTATAAPRPRPVAASITRGGRDELTATFSPAAFDPGYRSLSWQVRSTASPAACSAPAAAGAPPPCTIEFPARPALARLHVPRLVGCVARGPSVVYSGPSTGHEIALTFDDGPWDKPPSMAFVDLLARYHAPATFFEIGEQISKYDPTGAIERAMLTDGDMIGDHTWTHPDMAALPPAQQRTELRRTADAIRRATGFYPCLWRPPYGALSRQLESLARGLGFLTIDWNIDPRDWSLPGVRSIEQTVLSTARSGGIVEMHFGGGPRYETLDALPTIIATLRARGYRFVNLTQMLSLKLIYR